MNPSVEQRDTLRRWMPTLLAAAAIRLLARGIGKLFQIAVSGVVRVCVRTQGLPRFLQ